MLIIDLLMSIFRLRAEMSEDDSDESEEEIEREFVEADLDDVDDLEDIDIEGEDNSGYYWNLIILLGTGRR